MKNCGSPNWGEYTFKRLIRRATGTISFSKTFEAHHLLCVASVSSEIVSAPGIDGVIRETVWCINATANMYAMPLWGHTVKYYCQITAIGGSLIASLTLPPPFANVPQHDYDHNCSLGYTYEVEQKLKGVADAVEEAEHEITPKDIAGLLNSKSAEFKSTLQARGSRNGGTHAGWNFGKKDPTSRWYIPFSMASEGCLTAKGYPVRDFDHRVTKWINRIVEAMKK